MEMKMSEEKSEFKRRLDTLCLVCVCFLNIINWLDANNTRKHARASSSDFNKLPLTRKEREKFKHASDTCPEERERHKPQVGGRNGLGGRWYRCVLLDDHIHSHILHILSLSLSLLLTLLLSLSHDQCITKGLLCVFVCAPSTPPLCLMSLYSLTQFKLSITSELGSSRGGWEKDISPSLWIEKWWKSSLLISFEGRSISEAFKLFIYIHINVRHLQGKKDAQAK